MSIDKLKGTFSTTMIAAAGLSASRLRADACASNIANEESVGYRRRDVFQTAISMPIGEGGFSSTLFRDLGVAGGGNTTPTQKNTPA
jgi:flagellar basal body rod protein FlgG